MNFKKHPIFSDLKISSCGTVIKQNNIELRTVEYLNQGKYTTMLVYLYETYFSLSKLVNETYNGLPPDSEKRYYTKHKDNDNTNTHPDNLYWCTSNSGIYLDKDLILKKSLCKSKLTKEDSFYCYVMHVNQKKPLKELAAIYNVSDMSIYRAVKRIKNYLNE